MSESQEIHDIYSDESDPVINKLETRAYLKPACNNEAVISKIQHFSEWFNGTCRTGLLSCGDVPKEHYSYLLNTLKTNIECTLTELNNSNSYHKTVHTCRVCGEEIITEPWGDAWSNLEEHEHSSDVCSLNLAIKKNDSEVVEIDSASSSSRETLNGEVTSSSEMNSTAAASLISNLVAVASKNSKADACSTEIKPAGTPRQDLNSFRFNFSVSYDPIVESTYYPKSLVSAARHVDHVSEYTVRRCSPGVALCLLCNCPLNTKGKTTKVSPFVIKNHTRGSKHMKNATSCLMISAISRYHEFWRKQELSIQAQQVHFTPEYNSVVLRCDLCHELVAYHLVIGHIMGEGHKNEFRKLLRAFEGKSMGPYLLAQQAQIYDLAVAEPINDERRNGNVAVPAETIKCQVAMAKYDFTNLENISLPERFKEHKKFFEKHSNRSLTCKLCSINVSADAEPFKNHICGAVHRQLANLKHNKYYFHCEICDMSFKEEHYWEKHFTKGPNKHATTAKIRKDKLCEYECKTCLVVIYGDEMSVARHIAAPSRGRSHKKKKVQITLPHTIERLFKSKESVANEVARLLDEAFQTAEESRERTKECCEDLEQALGNIYPCCKVYPFGSRISGLGNMKSDLDIYLDVTGDMYHGTKNQDSITQEQFVKRAAKLLKSLKEDFNYVVPIPNARTPIIRLHHCYTDLDCDISFRHGLGVENTKFLRYCMDLQPLTQHLILLLKKWSDHCKLNENITNYGLALMAVFYLQTCGYLISLTTLRRYNPAPSLIINGWTTINYTVPVDKMTEYVKPCDLSVTQLLSDFFKFYSTFDYENQVVCPLLGHTIPKLHFTEPPDGSSLPPEMNSYVVRLREDRNSEFRALSPFCIQDPFDLSHNLTKACQMGTVLKLKTLCKLTSEFLDKIK